MISCSVASCSPLRKTLCCDNASSGDGTTSGQNVQSSTHCIASKKSMVLKIGTNTRENTVAIPMHHARGLPSGGACEGLDLPTIWIHSSCASSYAYTCGKTRATMSHYSYAAIGNATQQMGQRDASSGLSLSTQSYARTIPNAPNSLTILTTKSHSILLVLCSPYCELEQLLARGSKITTRVKRWTSTLIMKAELATRATNYIYKLAICHK